MRRSDIGKWAVKLASLYSHYDTYIEPILGALFRKPSATKADGDTRQSADDQSAKEGRVGWFGYGDEQSLQIALSKVNKEQRDAINTFLRTYYTGPTPVMKLIGAVQLHRFRIFFAGLGSSPGTETGSIRKTTNLETPATKKKVRTTTTSKLFGPSSDNRHDFLMWMADTLMAEEPKTLAGRHKKVADGFRAGGIPTMPTKSEEAQDYLTARYRATNKWLTKTARSEKRKAALLRKEREQGRFSRLRLFMDRYVYFGF